MTAAANSPAVEALVDLQKAHENIEASIGLRPMINNASLEPKEKVRATYYLARALQELELYLAADHYYADVVAAGPADPNYAYALGRMVWMGNQTGDFQALIELDLDAAHRPATVEKTLAWLACEGERPTVPEGTSKPHAEQVAHEMKTLRKLNRRFGEFERAVGAELRAKYEVWTAEPRKPLPSCD